MDIELNRKGDHLGVIIDGNIDTEGGRKLSVSLQEAMDMEGIKSVVFNLTTVRAITSGGIGKLMNFFKVIDARKGRMEVKGISDQLYGQFMEIHLDRIFPVSK
jgi:anti-sigma B factor antagonist